MDLRERITIEPSKRGGKPCIRELRITVYDVLGWLAAGMQELEILRDYPDLEAEDIRACLAFVAEHDADLERLRGEIAQRGVTEAEVKEAVDRARGRG